MGDFINLRLIDPATGSTIVDDLLPVDRTVHTPGFAQVLDLVETYPELRGYEAVRVQATPVQVTSEGADARLIWGFAGVSHDETQHVTTISPQP